MLTRKSQQKRKSVNNKKVSARLWKTLNFDGDRGKKQEFQVWENLYEDILMSINLAYLKTGQLEYCHMDGQGQSVKPTWDSQGIIYRPLMLYYKKY